eukprot:1343301-Rhodomonas_salina.2
MTAVEASRNLTIFVKGENRSLVSKVSRLINKIQIRTVHLIFPIRLLMSASDAELESEIASSSYFTDVSKWLKGEHWEVSLLSSQQPENQAIKMQKRDDSFIIFEIARKPEGHSKQAAKAITGPESKPEAEAFKTVVPSAKESEADHDSDSGEQLETRAENLKQTPQVPEVKREEPEKEITPQSKTQVEISPKIPLEISDIALDNGKMSEMHLAYLLRDVCTGFELGRIIGKCLLKEPEGFKPVDKTVRLNKEDRLKKLVTCRPEGVESPKDLLEWLLKVVQAFLDQVFIKLHKKGC